MATIPTPFTQQVNPPANETVMVFEVPVETILGTLSVRVLNAGNSTATFSLWLLPSGVGIPEKRHLIQSNMELRPGSSNVDFGISVGSGYRVFVESSTNDMVYTCNMIAHLNPALQIPSP